MKEHFYNTDYKEQESTINIDYSKKEICLYTNRQAVYERITKKIGKPSHKYYIHKRISGVSWNIPFENKRSITAILSRPTLIGNMK